MTLILPFPRPACVTVTRTSSARATRCRSVGSPHVACDSDESVEQWLIRNQKGEGTRPPLAEAERVSVWVYLGGVAVVLVVVYVFVFALLARASIADDYALRD